MRKPPTETCVGIATGWLALWLVLGLEASASAQPKGPWWIDVSHESATLVAELRRGALRVELDCEGQSFDIESEGGRAPDRGVLHMVKFDDLPPNTRCRGTARGESFDEHVELRTAPSPSRPATVADESTDPFTFLVYGDVRTNHGVHRRVISHMREELDARFVAHTGDFVEVGGRPRDWQQFFEIAKPVLSRVPLYPTLGNHEIYGPGGRRRYQRYMVDHERRVAWQSWTHGPVKLISLDSNDEWEANGAQHEWLRAQLDDDDDPSVNWRIVFLHHGPVSSGRHGGHETMASLGLADALRDAGVDLVLAGHDHIYERGDSGGLKYIVTGGGGAPLYPVNRHLVSQLAFKVAHHYLRFTVQGERLEMTAVTDDGEILERCGFDRGRPWECSLEAGIDEGEPPKSRMTMWLVMVVVLVIAAGAYGWRKTRPRR